MKYYKIVFKNCLKKLFFRNIFENCWQKRANYFGPKLGKLSILMLQTKAINTMEEKREASDLISIQADWDFFYSVPF